MNYEELKESWMNGNKKDVVYEIKHNFGWYDFANEVEDDCELSDSEKLEMLASAIRIAF